VCCSVSYHCQLYTDCCASAVVFGSSKLLNSYVKVGSVLSRQASNSKQVANLLCAEYSGQLSFLLSLGWEVSSSLPVVGCGMKVNWDSGMSAKCTVGPVVH